MPGRMRSAGQRSGRATQPTAARPEALARSPELAQVSRIQAAKGSTLRRCEPPDHHGPAMAVSPIRRTEYVNLFGDWYNFPIRGRDALPTARQSASIGHDELQPVDLMRLLLSLLASLTFLSALAPSAPAQQGETLRIGIARRSGYPRSDLLAHLCRYRRDDGAVRQAVRLRCEAEHRAGAGHRLRMGGRQDVADQAAHRGAVPQRGKIRRRCGEILVGTPPERQRQLPPQRDRCDGPCRGGRSADRAGGDEAGVLAVRRHPDRSRRHDAAAEGSRDRRQGFRPASGVHGAVPVRRTRCPGPHHAGALPRLLGRAAHPL